MKKISVVVPCYNEEDVINTFYNELISTLNLIQSYTYEIIFIDDGSKDNTLKLLKEKHLNNNKIKILSFSRNFGKESAIYACLENTTGDLIVVMDADMQHPPQKMIEMLRGIEERI